MNLPWIPGRIAVLLVAVLLGTLGTCPAAEEESSQREFDALVAEWDFLIAQAEQELSRPGVSRSLAESLRPQIERVENAAETLAADSRVRIDTTHQLLDTLGPAPGVDEPPEEESAAAQRRQLRDQLATHDGRLKQAELIIARARLVIAKISQTARERRTERLLAHTASPLRTSTLTVAIRDLYRVGAALRDAPMEELMPGYYTSRGRRNVPDLVFLILFAGGVGWLSSRWLQQRYGRTASIAEPSFARRLRAAIVVGVARGLIPSLIAGACLTLALVKAPPNVGLVGNTFLALLGAFIFICLVAAVARAALAPDSPAWRLSPLTDKGARRIFRRLLAVTVLVALDAVLEFLTLRHFEISPELSATLSFVINTMLAMLVLSLVPASLWKVAENGQDDSAPRSVKRRSVLVLMLRLIAAVTALAIPVSAILGYTNLSNFLTTELVLTGLVLGLLFVTHGLARDVVRVLMAERAGTSGDALPEDQDSRILRFWFLVAFDLLLILVGAAILLPSLGVAFQDLEQWIRRAAAGISIGSFTLSLTDFLLAILVFVAILLGTRWSQRVLEEQVLPQTRLDLGVRASLKTAIGYVGLVLGITASIVVLGLDLTNLALIAGALSVGIGFGLQNVVGNFVSGLILIVERPVKVGDWVVIADVEGYVKRISVRATEIQTFQRASVIIPNSDVLSSAVINWTHKDTFGRVDIPIGVAYGSDTTQVREILLDCANRHPKVSAWPEAHVLFLDFGGSSLDFQLRFHISNVDERLRIASDVRFAIDDAFREHGIEIPFQQTDIHLRDMERLEQLLERGGEPPGRQVEPGPAPRNAADEGDSG
jgi:potassium-dependent mechanosensitive channel